MGYWYYRVSAYSVTDKFASDDLANGDPASSLGALGKGSYMQITKTDLGFRIQFELKDADLTETFNAKGVTISGNYDDFLKSKE